LYLEARSRSSRLVLTLVIRKLTLTHLQGKREDSRVRSPSPGLFLGPVQLLINSLTTSPQRCSCSQSPCSFSSILSHPFDHRSTASSRFVASPSTSSDTDVPPLDEKYTGHILVSGYQVSFVLPSELPPLPKLGSRLDNAGDYTPFANKTKGETGIDEREERSFSSWPYQHDGTLLDSPQRAPWLVSFVRMFGCRPRHFFLSKALHTDTSLPNPTHSDCAFSLQSRLLPRPSSHFRQVKVTPTFLHGT